MERASILAWSFFVIQWKTISIGPLEVSILDWEGNREKCVFILTEGSMNNFSYFYVHSEEHVRSLLVTAQRSMAAGVMIELYRQMQEITIIKFWIKYHQIIVYLISTISWWY